MGDVKKDGISTLDTRVLIVYTQFMNSEDVRVYYKVKLQIGARRICSPRFPEKE